MYDLPNIMYCILRLNGVFSCKRRVFVDVTGGGDQPQAVQQGVDLEGHPEARVLDPPGRRRAEVLLLLYYSQA